MEKLYYENQKAITRMCLIIDDEWVIADEIIQTYV